LQAVLALDVYRQKENLSFYDATMVFSSELLQAHADSFNEYALCLGKQSQGLNTFKSNVLALTDKSKLLSANPPVKDITEQLSAAKAIQAHGSMHERCQSLAIQLASDLNSDYSALF
jgi:hypothetical protein